MAVDEHCATASGVATIHITPAVAHHPASRQINIQLPRRALQHAGLGLPTVAIRRAFAGMITDFDAINRQLRRHVRMDFFNDFLGERAAANIGLIRGHDQKKTGSLELRAGGGNVEKNFKFGQTRRRIRFPLALQRTVNYPVAIKKNCATNC